MRLSSSIRLLANHLLIVASLVISYAHAETPPIQTWIDEAIKKGGGVVTIPPGVHVLPKGLMLKDAKKLSLRGMEKEGCILRLPPVAYAECAEDTPAGSTTLPVRGARQLQIGMRLNIAADGEINSFTKKPTPYLLAWIKEIQGDTLVLREALKYPVPAGAVLRHEDAGNLIEIRGDSEQVEIANLTLDGGQVVGDPEVHGHAQLCAVFASGAYSYETGPKGTKPKGIVIRDCVIQHCFGRGVAFYCVDACTVERSSIMDTNDEAVDLDHFATKCVVRGNHMTRSHVAVELNDANDCLVEGNEARDCGLGINLWRWCKQPGLNEGNIIRNNLFKNTAGNGFQIATGTARNVFENNEIDQTGRNGISLSGDAQVLRGNKIQGAKMKEITILEGKHEIESLPAH